MTVLIGGCFQRLSMEAMEFLRCHSNSAYEAHTSGGIQTLAMRGDAQLSMEMARDIHREHGDFVRW
eukprot:CAMPEP_0119332446 /NCGR_PEP_ID=MMETSP1333-20130426/82785_1 /TAXON_ID=418940 /ORGANISM="Scyphosphaera apsteinii, Strain RCC1455" /LENGTH=65 /DNA_ID=CAMNT_0007342275 /DNA_START=41 /DNA_END=235 /DNA_ORIENTATION=-